MNKRMVAWLVALLCCCYMMSAAAEATLTSDQILELLDRMWSPNDPTHTSLTQYTYFYDEPTTTYYIYAYIDGMAVAKALALTDETHRKQWDTLVQSFVGINETSLETEKQFSSPSEGIHCIFTLFNDLDPTETLLTVYDSTVTLNVVDGTNIDIATLQGK